jgi:ribosomal protein S30
MPSDGSLPMIRKLKSGEYRLYSRKKNPQTGRRRNLGTFTSRAAAEKHERAVQYFKRAK